MMMMGMFLFWILLAVVAVWLAGVLFPGARRSIAGPAPSIDPLTIAAERYARGEIKQDEYLQVRADLGSR